MDTKVEAMDLDFEEWKDKELEELHNQASKFSRKKINRSIYFARKIAKTIENLEAEFRMDSDNQNIKDLQEKYLYFKGLSSALFIEMFSKSPVECIAEIQRTALPKEEQLTREDIENSIYSFTYREICKNKILENDANSISLRERITDNPEDQDAKQELEKLDKQYDFYIKRRDESSSHIHPYINSMISSIYPTLSLKELSRMHEQYLSDLAKLAGDNQLVQEDLLARYENGELDDVSTQVNELQEKFEGIFHTREDLKLISSLIPSLYDRLDFNQINDDDYALSATGSEAFSEMNKKERYHAKVKAHEIKTGKHPNKLKKLFLHLPSKKMDELIKQYIDQGRLPLEEVMGCSREELLVRMEARKLAQKMRKDKEAENNEPNQEGQEEKEQQDQGDKEGQAQEAGELLEEEPGSTPKSFEELPEEELLGEDELIGGEEPESIPKSDNGFDVEAQADEMVKLLNELSLDARIDFLMTTFNLPEENREVLMLFESLSPEAREAFCRGEMSAARDEIDRDTKEDQVIE